MMDEIRDAIEAAITHEPVNVADLGKPRKRLLDFDSVHYTLLAVLNELPDWLTVRELREELDIANNQERRRR